MTIQIEFLAQLGQLAGGKHRTVPLDGARSAQELLRRAIADDPAEFRKLILDDQGDLQPSLLMFVRDCQVDWQQPVALQAGDIIVLSPPIAGG